MIKVSILLEGTTKADYILLSQALDSKIVTPPDISNNDWLAEEIKKVVKEYMRRRHGPWKPIVDNIVVVAMQVLKDES